jgi:hypothetical protein
MVSQTSNSGFSQGLNRGILVCPSLMVHCIHLSAVSEKTAEVMHDDKITQFVNERKGRGTLQR